MTDTALATVAGVESFMLDGQKISRDIASVLQNAVVDRTIDGASTLTLDVYDHTRSLLRSGIFSDRTTAAVDGYAFELVQVKKNGHALSLVFEDLPVAALRRHTTPIKVSPNTVTHVDFAERLVNEEGWLNFWVPPELRSVERARVPLARGRPETSLDEEPEDSWTALGRISEERGWRRFVINRDTVAYVPETYLVAQDPVYVLREGRGGVEDIDFDFDVGKPTATVRVRVRAGRWAVPVGAAVSIEEMGPANGNWLVSGISRSLFSLFIEVTLTKARPVLPEPVDVAPAPAATAGAGSGPSSVLSLVTPVEVAQVADPETYPQDPSNMVSINQGNHRLIPSAAASFFRVQARFGLRIKVTDSYRSVAVQEAAYRLDPSRFASPRSSAHGEARAVDVDLKACGVGNQSPDPKKWDQDPTWKRLNEAFMEEGWCNYQYHNGSTKGKRSEPWHWAYKVCK